VQTTKLCPTSRGPQFDTALLIMWGKQLANQIICLGASAGFSDPSMETLKSEDSNILGEKKMVRTIRYQSEEMGINLLCLRNCTGLRCKFNTKFKLVQIEHRTVDVAREALNLNT
jgi:hypothetical protein